MTKRFSLKPANNTNHPPLLLPLLLNNHPNRPLLLPTTPIGVEVVAGVGPLVVVVAAVVGIALTTKTPLQITTHTRPGTTTHHSHQTRRRLLSHIGLGGCHHLVLILPSPITPLQTLQPISLPRPIMRPIFHHPGWTNTPLHPIRPTGLPHLSLISSSRVLNLLEQPLLHRLIIPQLAKLKTSMPCSPRT